MPERSLPVVSAWKWWTGFFTVVGFALFMTARAYLEGLPSIFTTLYGFDKFVHFSVAGLLAFFLDGALARRAFLASSLPLAAVLVLVPSGIEEFMQRFSSLRQSTISDFLADIAGVTVMIAVSRRVAR